VKTARPIRVLLVTPSASERGRLARLLRRAGLRVLVRTGDAVASLETVAGAGRRPDVVLLDPGPEGHPPIPLLLAHSATLEANPCVILQDDLDGEAAARAVRAGARAVLPRGARPAEIVAAVQAAAAGLTAVPARWASGLFRAGAPDTTHPAGHGVPDHPLTAREREILALLGEGLGNKQVAARLGISDHTVKTHLVAIYEKLGAGNRAEAVATGLRRGLIML
jgi:DNA-binding NarL/FixJ family response regulator